MTDKETLKRIEQKYHFVPLIIAIVGLVLYHILGFDFVGLTLVLISAGLAIGGMYVRFVMKEPQKEVVLLDEAGIYFNARNWKK